MLLAFIGCVLGIVIESVKWPQDRSKAIERYLESEGLWENLVRGVGLALGHQLVRWLLALLVASWSVAAVLGSPFVLPYVKHAIDTQVVSKTLVDVLTGSSICVLMTVLALVARRFAR
jgi:hypothetical protein